MKSIKVFLVIVASFVAGAFAVYTGPDITRSMVSEAAELIGLDFTTAEIDTMLEDLKEQRASYDSLRKISIPNDIPPAVLLNPIPAGWHKGETAQRAVSFAAEDSAALPKKLEEVAYWPIPKLAALLRSKKITSVQLTQMYIARLKKYDPQLHCVITLTEERAMHEAKRADEEIAAGKYRGPLHGIPYGVKDLLAAKGYPATWGSAIFKGQLIEEDATVVKRLSEAGAVLVAKLSMGELAWGDVWYGGKTRSPWNTAQGSSGSSAGSASAVSAGLVPFAIGSETWGSIVSPSTACGVTGLRPTYGRVSRKGAMALSWSMDKLGPICRDVNDCAIVFNAIYGPDEADQTLYDFPFNYSNEIDVYKKLRVGYLKGDFENNTDSAGKVFEQATLEVFRRMGVELIPVELPNLPVFDMSIILTAEAAAAFDELTRSGKDSLMVRQVRNAWPNVFRAARTIPAVEYIQANRIRYMLVQEMAKLMKQVDVYIAPSFAGSNLLLTNLTGHPCVVVPNGFRTNGMPASITFIGDLFGEADVLAVANAYQRATDFHLKRPKLK